MLIHELNGVRRLKHQPSGQKPVADAAKSIEVDTMVGYTVTPYHLGSDIGGCTSGAIRSSEQSDVSAFIHRFDQPEVQHLHEIHVEGQPTGKDVGRLDISVDQPPAMSLLE